MKFCFFGYISCAVKGQTIGGGELQIYLLAKALALQGHEVIIIDPYAEEPINTSEGINLITVPNWNKGWRGLRMFFYRIPSLFKVFREQNADFYYVRMRSYIHLIPYLISKRTGRKFIQAIASDIDVLSESKKIKYEYKTKFNFFKFLTQELPNDLVFKFLLNVSDFVLLQHNGQKFKSISSKKNQVIFQNIIDLKNIPYKSNPKKDYYLYVGAITMLKGADKLLDLINIVDDSIHFVIVGSPSGDEPKFFYEELKRKKNVTLKGWLSHNETLEYISNSIALINISYFEGFPNIFLEAWACGVAVISLNVNPGNILEKNALGICCYGDLIKMKSAIELNHADNFDREKLVDYVNENHNFISSGIRFLKTIS